MLAVQFVGTEVRKKAKRTCVECGEKTVKRRYCKQSPVASQDIAKVLCKQCLLPCRTCGESMPEINFVQKEMRKKADRQCEGYEGRQEQFSCRQCLKSEPFASFVCDRRSEECRRYFATTI